jgi:hypothetical protein
MTDAEKIQEAMSIMARANGSVAVQTITFIIGRWQHENGDKFTIDDACQSLDVLGKKAAMIADDPGTWTECGRFSELRCLYYYPPKDKLGIHKDLSDVLNLLDRQYKTSFRIESAQNYLRDVEWYANHLREQLENARS